MYNHHCHVSGVAATIPVTAFKKTANFQEARRFITVFTTAGHWSLT